MLRCLPWILALLPFSYTSPLSVNSQDNAEDSYCGRETYGLPDIVDCHPLLESFAYYKDYSQRVFDEEQMRLDQKGSWPGVLEIVGADHLDRVVQVPRYYSLNSCNFALMSYTSGFGSINALGGTSWALINAKGNFLMTKCLLNGPKASGGVAVIPSIGQPKQPVLSLFMWESGSLFDLILNSFTNTPAGMVPAPGNGLAFNRTSVNTTILPRAILGGFP